VEILDIIQPWVNLNSELRGWQNFHLWNAGTRHFNTIFQNADADGSGTVDFQEFVELMIKRESEKETEEDLKQAFRVFDKVLFLFLETSSWVKTLAIYQYLNAMGSKMVSRLLNTRQIIFLLYRIYFRMAMGTSHLQS
jgi:hypothetical protein